MALEWHTLFSFGHFRGGDVALGAATPWMLLWGWQVRARPWLYLAGIPVMLAGGLYLKLAAVLLTGPILVAAGLANCWKLRTRPVVLVLWAVAAIVLAGGTWLAVQKGFFNRGLTPAAGGMTAREIFSPLVFSMLSPWLAATGFGSLLGHVWWWLGRDVDEIWLHFGWFVLPFAVVAWWWPGRWVLRCLDREKFVAVSIVLLASVAMLASLFVRGSPVGVDDRYMRPTATVLLLLLALHLDAPGKRDRRLAGTTIALIVAFGIGSAAQRCLKLARMDSVGREEYTQQHLTRATVAKLAAIDAIGAPRSTLVYIPMPEVRMEISRQRVLFTDDFSINREHRWAGRVPKLVVAVPSEMERDGRAAHIRGEFVDYATDEWHYERVDDWWFWSAEKSDKSSR